MAVQSTQMLPKSISTHSGVILTKHTSTFRNECATNGLTSLTSNAESAEDVALFEGHTVVNIQPPFPFTTHIGGVAGGGRLLFGGCEMDHQLQQRS